MELQRKLEILADAAKYDASCPSSGTELQDSSDGKGLGSTAPGMGICHSRYCEFRRHCERSEAIQTFFVTLDCFAKPVIGWRALRRPVGSQ
jgi:predicted DNA-binding helix-hairpin-helix protein